MKPPLPPRHSSLLILAGMVLLSGGCSLLPSRSPAPPQERMARHCFPGAADPFSGAWSGRWTSAKHHHPFSQKAEGGPLRCEFTPLDAHHYQARFTAGWLVFTSHFAATLEAERHGRELRFRGDQNLGFLYGGVYHYQGVATAQRFSACYDSSYDRGVFEMSRPNAIDRLLSAAPRSVAPSDGAR